MISKLFSTLCSVLLCTIPFLATLSLAQGTINVGTGRTYKTIQSGINAANPGDTVLVDPGTYYENIDFKGKAITVTSSGGATATTINGGNTPGMATVVFINSETSASILSNFTITGGGDLTSAGNMHGGIYLDRNATVGVAAPSPTIQNNIITANYCHDISAYSSNPNILNNEISGVLLSQQAGSFCYVYAPSGIFLGASGGPYVASSLGSIVTGNFIENNLTEPGITLNAAQNALIANNTIRNNSSPNAGSAISSINSVGVVLFQNLIYGNSSMCGGALGLGDGGYVGVASPFALIANNTIVDNVALNAVGSGCQAISQIYPGQDNAGAASGPGVVIVNNIISGSTPYPAVNCYEYGTPSLSTQPTFQNNILYNGGGSFFGTHCIDVTNSDHNIAADPQFVSPSTGDYHLKITSPAIDTGNNSVLQTYLALTGRAISTDFDGKPRVQSVNSSTACIIDMGAYEYTGTTTGCSTTETLVSSPNPSTFGQSVTFTAQLSSVNGVPTGDVQFTDGTTILATQTISTAGVSTFTTSTLAAGSHSITATYQPTGTFSATTASLTQVVNGTPTTTTLTCSPNPTYVTVRALFSASVTSSIGTPAGSFTFTDNGTALTQTTAVNGAATYAYSTVTSGMHNIVATFVPTDNSAGSSASCSEVINPIPTATILTVTPTTTTYGSSVTLTAHLTNPPGPGVPIAPTASSGTVTFYNGTTSIGTGTVAGGVASLTLTNLPAPTDNLTCSYGGTFFYATSTCNAVPINITPGTSALTLTSSSNPTPALSPITFTTHLTSGGQSAGAGNTTTLTLNGQSTNLTTDATGTATFTNSTLTPGTYAVAANFAATASLAANSASLNEIVTAIPTTTTLTVAPTNVYLNQSVTITATVASATGISTLPTGTITLSDGTTSLATQLVNASGAATLSISTLTVGTHPITATFTPSNTLFNTSTSITIDEIVSPSGFTLALSPTTLKLPPGSSGTAAIQLTGIGNFSGPLTLTYGTLPTYATASISPATVTLTAGGHGSSTLTLNTLLKASNTIPSRPGTRALPTIVTAFALLLLPATFTKRRRLARLLSLALLAFAFQAITGCTNAYYTASTVAVGTYQLPITATDGNHNTQTALLTVTVTP